MFRSQVLVTPSVSSGHRAHPVHEHSPGGDELHGRVDQLGLKCGEASDVLGLHAPSSIGTTAQHAQAGARSIDEHPVEATGAKRQVPRVGHEEEQVGFERLDVRDHRLHSALAHVGRDDQRIRRGKSGRLAAGRRAHISDAHPGLRLDEVGQPLGRLVLDEPSSRMRTRGARFMCSSAAYASSRPRSRRVDR
jgi:hypothetical protein